MQGAGKMERGITDKEKMQKVYIREEKRCFFKEISQKVLTKAYS